MTSRLSIHTQRTNQDFEDKAAMWLATIEKARAEIGQVLEKLDDGDCLFLLESLRWNGWRRPSGEWRDVHDAR